MKKVTLVTTTFLSVLTVQGFLIYMENLVQNVLVECFGSKVNLERKVQLAVKRYTGLKWIVPILPRCVSKETFLCTHPTICTQVLTFSLISRKDSNAGTNFLIVHVNKLPFISIPQTWWSWDRTSVRRAPFYSEPTRHSFDVFMNRYHRRLSTILGCNTNVQCGIDSAHMMYVTYYSTTKNTQTEDKLAYWKVAKLCMPVSIDRRRHNSTRNCA
jgi:hypothetical protein